MRDADRLGAAGSVGQIDILRESVPPVDGQDTAVRALFRENRDFMTDFAGELERGAFRRRYFQRQPVVFAPPCAAGAERGKRDALESVVQREEDVAAFRSLRNSRRINRERDRFFGQRDFFMRQAEAEPENEKDRQRDRRANCEEPLSAGEPEPFDQLPNQERQRERGNYNGPGQRNFQLQRQLAPGRQLIKREPDSRRQNQRRQRRGADRGSGLAEPFHTKELYYFSLL